MFLAADENKLGNFPNRPKRGCCEFKSIKTIITSKYEKSFSLLTEIVSLIYNFTKSPFNVLIVFVFTICSLAFTALGDHESSRECYRKALELDPTNQSYQNNLEIAEQKLREEAMQVGHIL